MTIQLGKTLCVSCSVADNGINDDNNQVCVVTASSLLDTLSVKYFF